MRLTDEHRQRLADLHDRLCRDDRTAVGAFFLFAGELIEPAVRAGRRVDQEKVYDAITDALRRHWERPDRFDAGRGVPLHEYLIAAARNNLSNILRTERRLKRREAALATDHDSSGGNVVRHDPLAGYMARERLEQCIAALPNERDQAFLELLAADVDDVARLAAALGEAAASPGEQAAAVERARERIRKQLKRRGLRR